VCSSDLLLSLSGKPTATRCLVAFRIAVESGRDSGPEGGQAG
jgi:hypothetical protein